MKLESEHTYWLITGDSQLTDISLLDKVMQVFLETMGLSKKCSAGLVFCQPDEMNQVNKKYRGVDCSTDVLSFPADNETGLFREDDDGNIYLGEILVDINYILNQTNSKDINKEIAPVLVHGLLHLLGFDHLNTDQKKKMQYLEAVINSRISTS